MNVQAEDLMYVVDTDKPFREAVVAVRRAAEGHQWTVLGDYDFAEILAAKGFPQEEEVKVLDLCAPAHASALMGVKRLAGLYMPCNVLVFTEEGRTKIASIKPGTAVLQLFPEAKQEAESQLNRINIEIQTILNVAAR